MRDSSTSDQDYVDRGNFREDYRERALFVLVSSPGLRGGRGKKGLLRGIKAQVVYKIHISFILTGISFKLIIE